MFLAGILVLVVGLHGAVARAGDITWTGLAGSGNPYWDIAGNWDLLRLPHGGDDVQLLEPPSFVSPSYTVYYRSAGDPAINLLHIEGFTTKFTLSQQQDALTSDWLEVVDHGAYEIGGSAALSIMNDAYIGLGSGSPVSGSLMKQTGGMVRIGASGGYLFLFTGASYQLSAGTLFASQNVELSGGSFQQSGGTVTVMGAAYAGTDTYGGAGTGLFSQSAGAFAAPELTLGEHSGNAGTYDLSGTGSLSVGVGSGGQITLGNNGSGVFYQHSANSIVQSDRLYLGNNSGASGTYTLSAGTLTLTEMSIAEAENSSGKFILNGGVIDVAERGYVGRSGTGEFVNSIGTHTITELVIGDWSTGVGTYTLSGSGYLHSSNVVDVARHGIGTFIQSGGTHSTQYLTVGVSDTAAGTYMLSHGTLEVAGNTMIAWEGNGTFAQTGGVHSATRLTIGGNPSAQGTYSLSNGTLTLTDGSMIGDWGKGYFAQSGGVHTAAWLTLGGAEDGSGTYLMQNGQLSVENNLVVGYLGTGNWTQSDGTVTTQYLTVGSEADSNGTYTMTGGWLTDSTVAGGSYIGEYGHGTFLQSGGTYSVSNGLVLGDGDIGAGTYVLSSAATLLVDGDTDVGRDGTGLFTHSDGLHETFNLHVGEFLTGVGSYTLSGGTLTVDDISEVGMDGTGTFMQTRGTFDAHLFILGSWNHGNGTYTLQDGTLSSDDSVYIGDSGHGYFHQTGGNLSANWFGVGVSSGGAGTYVMDGGTLSTSDALIVAVNGDGTFQQTGGTVHVGAWMNFADQPATSSNYLHEGGTLSVAQTIAVGNAGTAVLTQNGGEMDAAWELIVGHLATSGATFNLNGGSVTAENLTVGAMTTHALVHQTGGTLSAGFIVLGRDDHSGGAYVLDGGTLCNLHDDWGGMNIGQSGTGILTNTGGYHLLNGDLVLGDGTNAAGTYLLSGAAQLEVHGSTLVGRNGTGTISQSGGAHTTEFLSLGSGASGMGVYTLSSGLLHVYSNSVIGWDGAASFIQNGGTHDAGWLGIASGASGHGTYTLGSGTLDVENSSVVGDFGAGTFIQSGGVHEAQWFTVASTVDSSGTYLLSAGTLRVERDSIVGSGGAGTFIQSGGNHIAWAAAVGDDNSGSGFYDMQAGTFNVTDAYLVVGRRGNAVFNQTGGRVWVNSLVVLGMEAPSNATYLLNGASARLDAGAGIFDEIVAYEGSATFDQRAGTHTLGQNLIIASQPGSHGTFLISGGTFTTQNVFNNAGGYFRYDGGRVNVSERFHNSGTTIFNADIGSAGKSMDVSNFSPSMTFNSSQHLRSLTIVGPHSKTTLSAGGGKVLNVDDLAMDVVGKLDLTDNALIIDYTGDSPMSWVQGSIQHARAGGAWSQSGIATSLGDATHYALGVAESSDLFWTFPASFEGDPVDATSVLVKYTYYGDANLDGAVDLRDLYQLACHWKTHDDWFCGDFNYDNYVDVQDLTLLAVNWQAGVGSPLGGSLESAIIGLHLPLVVPEPLGLCLAPLMLVLLNRRRKCV
jgi:hypothetical protein